MILTMEESQVAATANARQSWSANSTILAEHLPSQNAPESVSQHLLVAPA